MEIIGTVIDWYMANLSYLTILLLMMIESSFIPFPSEVVIPFAAYKAAEGELSTVLVVVFGTVGALMGAYINYYISLWLGRPIVYKLAGSKIGRMMLLSKDKIQNAEDYFVRNGRISTFIGRLVPAVRQIISIPAGLSKMNIRDFTLFTLAGVLLWNLILAIIGYFLYELKDIIFPYLKEILIFVGVAFLMYLVYKGIKAGKQKRHK